MFGNSRARSGLIVLPCGAVRMESCIQGRERHWLELQLPLQWRRVVLLFVTVTVGIAMAWFIPFFLCVAEGRVKLMVKDKLEPISGPCILITTYYQLFRGKKIRQEREALLNEIELSWMGIADSRWSTCVSSCKLSEGCIDCEGPLQAGLNSYVGKRGWQNQGSGFPNWTKTVWSQLDGFDKCITLLGMLEIERIFVTCKVSGSVVWYASPLLRSVFASNRLWQEETPRSIESRETSCIGIPLRFAWEARVDEWSENEV